MSYTEVWTEINGALDDEFTVDEDGIIRGLLSYDTWLKKFEAEAKSKGFVVEVYEIEHDHNPTSEECGCVQYLTDHKPSYTFGGEEEEA